MSSSLALLLLWSCAPELAPPPTTTSNPTADLDGDGFPDALDCDDANAGVHPTAAERANRFDDDCDGVVDEGSVFFDDDGDGFTEQAGDCDDADPDRSPAAAEVAYDGVDQDCNGLDLLDADRDGHDAIVVGGDDCDDARPDVHPGAVELADGLDGDCDGTVDEGTAAFDDDGDGLAEVDGDCDDTDPDVGPHAVEVAYDLVDNDCDGTDLRDLDRDQHDALIVGGTDCDDGDAAVNPSAPDLPYDGVDQDCDGADLLDVDLDGYDAEVVGGLDCDDLRLGVNPSATEEQDGLDQDCDGRVDESTDVWDDDGDGFTEAAGDCDDGHPGVYPGAAEVCGNGLDDNCNGSSDGCGPGGELDLSDADVVLTGVAASDFAGASLGGGHDLDGDGSADLAVGVPGAAGGGSDRGSVVVMSGPLRSRSLSGVADVAGVTNGDGLGSAVLVVPDADGDGAADLWMGAELARTAGFNGAGGAWLVAGPLAGATLASAAALAVEGTVAGGALGTSLAWADVDDDGVIDLGAGMPGESTRGSRAGAVLALPGASTGVWSAADAATVILGTSVGEAVGTSLALGDLDGDGVGDFVAGAPGANPSGRVGAGAVYLFHGPAPGSWTVGDASLVIEGSVAGDFAGTSVAVAGDTDLDGFDDLWIGAPEADDGSLSGVGLAALVLGPLTGANLSLSAAQLTLTGVTSRDLLGAAVGGPGDADGDGAMDLLAGASGVDDGSSDEGAVYLVFGGATGSLSASAAGATFFGTDANERVGRALGPVGDLDGDGRDDLGLGGEEQDVTSRDEGTAWIVFGGPGL